MLSASVKHKADMTSQLAHRPASLAHPASCSHIPTPSGVQGQGSSARYPLSPCSISCMLRSRDVALDRSPSMARAWA